MQADAKAWHEGYIAGQHSMDAEHRAIATRLRALPLDGGSHENLSQIARAIWHNDFGWTQDACMGLRDELVRLIGGVSDGIAEPMTTDEFIKHVEEDTRRLRDDATKAGDGDDTCDSQCHGACAAGDGGCAGKQKEVGHGGTAHDCAADFRGRTGRDVVHLDGLVAYDVLWNERHKAIAELRKMTIDSDYHGNYQRIALAIGTVYDGESFASECVRDRLIHLLGGDQPSGIDVLREMDDGHSRTCPESSDGVSMSAPSVSITDELRKWASDRHCKGISHTDALNIGLIADRIDEQFDRICQQQEAVLQSIIDEVVEERKSDQLRIEKLEKQRDEARAKLDAIRGMLDG